ncbi:MAG: DUF3558 family protein [Actinobacteria bacterium]|nr:DUF3558 family protein [Actinomycetota bacterium]
MVLVSIVMALVAGCGSDSDETAPTPTTAAGADVATGAAAAAAAPAPPVKPTCELLSREDVAQALGNQVQAGVAAAKDCFWGTEVDGGTGLNLTVDKPAANRVAQQCQLRQSSVSKENREEVKGVGTSAVWVVEKLSLQTQGNLVACYDNSVVWVIITGEKEAGVLKDTATAIADKVHGRV